MYQYDYDGLNRLLNAFYQNLDQNLFGTYNETLLYDKNGNIQSLQRNGYDENPLFNIPVDNLTYTYDTNNKNLLKKVADSSGSTEGFKDGTNTGDDYIYDHYGNMTGDQNKGITAITYNHLNLPKIITFGTMGTITYLYDATGVKLKKMVTQDSIVTTTDYLSGFQYVTSTGSVTQLEFFPTAEGYVKPTPDNPNENYQYVYNYTDHLGNIRLSYSDVNENGSIEALTEILEENNYYPFGLKHKGYNEQNLNPEYQYKYQGQERQDELNLNWDSFKWRNYDYAIGRFMSIDPLAAEFPYNSTYAFAENSVVGFFELEGLEKVSIHTRAFAPFITFGGGFSGDGGDRKFTTSQNVTSRVKQTVNIDFDQNTPVVSGGMQTSDPSHHPLIGTKTAPSRDALKNVQIGETSTGAKQVSFQSEIEGANPLTPQSITPNIDVDGAFSISSNQETGVLSISANITGDKFPSTESFITDSVGNSVFIGVAPLEGSPFSSLKGEGGREMINNDLQINFNSDGVFQNVIYNGQQYSIQDYNKIFEDIDPNGNFK